MRLTELDPGWKRYSLEPASRSHGRPRADGTIQWGGFPVHTFAPVRQRKMADRVYFLCPCCFAANGGAAGTHRIAIDFVGGRTPDEACIHNDQGQPVRWNVTGDTFESLTLSPSIQIIGGCAWHGFVTNGEIVNA